MSNRYRFTTPRIEITAEEIQADLTYPVRAEGRATAEFGRRRAEHTQNGSVSRPSR